MKEELHEQNFPINKEIEVESRFELKLYDNSEEQHHWREHERLFYRSYSSSGRQTFENGNENEAAE